MCSYGIESENELLYKYSNSSKDYVKYIKISKPENMVAFLDYQKQKIFELNIQDVQQCKVFKESRKTGGRYPKTYFVYSLYLEKYDSSLYWIETAKNENKIIKLSKKINEICGMPVTTDYDNSIIKESKNYNFNPKELGSIDKPENCIFDINENNQTTEIALNNNNVTFPYKIVIFFIMAMLILLAFNFIMFRELVLKRDVSIFAIIFVPLFTLLIAFLFVFPIMHHYTLIRMKMNNETIIVEYYRFNKIKSSFEILTEDIEYIYVNRIEKGYFTLSAKIKQNSKSYEKAQKNQHWSSKWADDSISLKLNDELFFILWNSKTISSHLRKKFIQHLFYLEYYLQQNLNLKEI